MMVQPKRPEWDAPAAVDEYLRKLKHPLKPALEMIRAVILKADGRITEGIKWNSPSFYCNGWFATCNLRGKDSLLVIFHQGAKVKKGAASPRIDDPAGLLEWLGKDRCIAKFGPESDIAAVQAALTSVVRQWVQQM